MAKIPGVRGKMYSAAWLNDPIEVTVDNADHFPEKGRILLADGSRLDYTGRTTTTITIPRPVRSLRERPSRLTEAWATVYVYVCAIPRALRRHAPSIIWDFLALSGIVFWAIVALNLYWQYWR